MDDVEGSRSVFGMWLKFLLEVYLFFRVIYYFYFGCDLYLVGM